MSQWGSPGSEISKPSVLARRVHGFHGHFHPRPESDIARYSFHDDLSQLVPLERLWARALFAQLLKSSGWLWGIQSHHLAAH